MKTSRLHKNLSIFLASLLLLAVPIAASAAGTSTASITFTEGGLTWGDLDKGLTSMYLNFGSNPQPASAVAYTVIDAPHSITVEEGRTETADGWNVKVSVSAFSDGVNTFAGKIVLSNGVCASNASVEVESPIEIITNNTLFNVASAPETVTRGPYEIAWPLRGDVQLVLSDSEALLVERSSYTATMTWTLSATPTF